MRSLKIQNPEFVPEFGQGHCFAPFLKISEKGQNNVPYQILTPSRNSDILSFAKHPLPRSKMIKEIKFPLYDHFWSRRGRFFRPEASKATFRSPAEGRNSLPEIKKETILEKISNNTPAKFLTPPAKIWPFRSDFGRKPKSHFWRQNDQIWQKSKWPFLIILLKNDQNDHKDPTKSRTWPALAKNDQINHFDQNGQK